MTASIEYRTNSSSEEQIFGHLTACDPSFVPPLSQRVDLKQYSKKIADRAARFEAWEHGMLTGLVAAYCDNRSSRTAFITSVSVLPDHQGRGIALKLMENCIHYVRSIDFGSIELEVDSANKSAVGLYRKMGFKEGPPTGRSLKLTLELRKEL